MTKSKTIRHAIAVVPFLILLATLSIVMNCGNQNKTEMPSSDASKGSIIFSLTFEDVSSANDSRTAPGDDICETYGIDTITAAVRDAKNNEIVSKSWPCDAHTGTLSNIPADKGLLVLIVEALKSGEQLWSGEQDNIEIIAGRNIDVGQIDMESIGATNIAPTADAGPDQTVIEGTMVKLSGINSIDEDDGIASFEWYQTDGMEEVIFSTPDEPETWFLAPEVDNCGAKLAFELAVTDYADATSVDDCIVNVINQNQNLPPNADAGKDQTVNEGTNKVNLYATNSTDPDDNIASYEWKQLDDGGPTVILSDYYSPTPSFPTPAVGRENASMSFEVTVTDACGLQDTDTCIVNITWANTLPIAIANADPEAVVSGDVVTLDGSKSWDAEDADIASFSWQQAYGEPVALLPHPNGQIITFIAPDVWNKDPLLEFRLTVQDSDGGKGSDTCQVHVTPGPDTKKPTVMILNPEEEEVCVRPKLFRKDQIDFSGTASDNREVESVTWVNSQGGSGKARGTTDWSIDNIQLYSGINIITVTAIDTSGNEDSDSRIVELSFFCP